MTTSTLGNALEARGAAHAVATDAGKSWSLPAFAGRLVEVSGDGTGAPLTFAFRLVLEAQRGGEPVVWVGRKDAAFYPPDAAAAGVDLAALPVVRVVDALSAAGAADLLLRSGAFGLLVLDLGAQALLPIHAQTRLAALAKQHATAVLCVTEKRAARPSLGSLVSVRAQAVRTVRDQDRFRCEVRILKDKRRGPGWTHAEVCRGPDGVC